MVVVGVRDEDADDTELLGVARPRVVVLTTLELDLNLDIDVLSLEVVNDVEYFLPSSGMARGGRPPVGLDKTD